ncbi:MAG: hypothetical protein RSE18_01000 [Acinetobacter sp.]
MNFEEWFKKRHQKTGFYEKCLSGDDDATYLKHEMRKSWEISAKQQSVPEGFIFVPKDRLANMVDVIEKLFEGDSTLALGELLPIQQGLKVVIEAQQSNKE